MGAKLNHRGGVHHRSAEGLTRDDIHEVTIEMRRIKNSLEYKLFRLLRRGQVDRAPEPSGQKAAFVQEASLGLLGVPVNQAREVVVGLQGKELGKLILDSLLNLHRGLEISFAD